MLFLVNFNLSNKFNLIFYQKEYNFCEAI